MTTPRRAVLAGGRSSLQAARAAFRSGLKNQSTDEKELPDRLARQ
jgi:hypothetical protein